MGYKIHQKISRKNFDSYTLMEKLYHIYAGNQCLFPNIKEEDFSVTWNTVKGMVGLMQTNYTEEDLSYEEVMINRQHMLEASY
jgi:hypothetical protein